MHILIVKTSAIGDVVHTLPALNTLRKHFPAAHITWLVEEAAADLVLGHSALDRVLVCSRKRWIAALKKGAKGKTLREIAMFVRAVRDTRYDLVIDFQGLIKSAIWVAMARGKQKVGFGKGMEHSEHSYLAYKTRVPAVSMEIHALKRELLLLEAMGIDHAAVEFGIPIRPSDRREIRELLKRNGIVDFRRLVAVNPMAKWKTKLWEPGKFAGVAEVLARKGFSVVFTGSREDRGMVEDIARRMNLPAANLAGRTTLKGLAALYETSALVISTDTGPMHIAAGVNAPVLALFGPTAPWRTGPFGWLNQVVRLGVDCSPCFRRQCESMRCMREIAEEMVLARAEAMLADRAGEAG